MNDCIRCGEAPRVDETGYCGQCLWAVRVEIEQGFVDMCEYLRGWACFSDWEQTHRGHGPTRG